MVRRQKQIHLALALVVGSQLAMPSVAHADLRCVDLFYDSPFVRVRDSDSLRLENKDGSVAVFEANSYYRQTPFRDLVDFVLRRRPDQQKRIDDALTDGHARNGNTFQKKNPKTGQYDQEFAPQVNGAVIPLTKAFYEQQIQSMAPVARSLRQLLQSVFTSGDMFPRYRSADPLVRAQALTEIVNHLGISHLPPHEQRRLVDIVSESIYLELAMIDPRLKEYGFLPVIGFDAAIDTLQKVTAIYYEFNSGTPSGLSNNVQLLELVRQRDPALFAKFKDLLLDDTTFQNLRRAVESNAEAYTGQADGISVIIGPGSFNGANPDVAAISSFSGMPLVKSRDLYVGRHGYLYLNTGAGGFHPKVTGIYGRVEESAFLNSAKDGIGWITPDLKENEALGRKWGLPLRNGVNYAWKLDANGEKIGVEVDANGAPVVTQYYLGQMGRDPANPNAEPTGSFANLIKEKKLYFSGLGGRVIDDKRVFEIINRYLGQAHARPNEKGKIAGPPRTLTDKEVNEFYAHPEKFVVKVPDESGGVGVYLGPLLSKAELAAVVQKVKDDRALAKRTGQQPVLTIQDFVTASVMAVVANGGTVAEGQAYARRVTERGRAHWATTVPDWRFFVFQDAKGNVSAGVNSFLVRAAKRLSPSTNTSQGAGYGIGVVLDPARRTVRDVAKTVLPKRPQNVPLAESARQDLKRYFDSLREVIEIANSGPGAEAKLKEMAPENPYNLGFFNPNMKWNRLEILVQMHKEVIAELGLDNSVFMTTLKKFNSGETTLTQFKKELSDYRTSLLTKLDFQHSGVRDLVVAGVKHADVPGLRAPSKLRPRLHSYFVEAKNVAFTRERLASFLRDHVTLEKITPTVLRETYWQGAKIEIVQVARVVSTTDAAINSFIAELAAVGGSIRYVRQRDESGKFLWSPPAAEFGVTKDGKPVVDIDLNQAELLAGLRHEREHFLDWLKIYGELKTRGLDGVEAAVRAKDVMIENVDFQRESEVRAVAAELDAETRFRDSPFMSGTDSRPTKFWETSNGLSYISRILYPDVVAVGRVINQLRAEFPVRTFTSEMTPAEMTRLTRENEALIAPKVRERAEKYLTNIILQSASNRTKSITYLRDVHTKYASHPDQKVRARAEEARAEADRLEKTPLFDLVFRAEERNFFQSAGNLTLLQTIYKAQYARLGMDARQQQQQQQQ